TRADAGSLQLDLQSLDLAELARARCEVFSGLATRQGMKLKVEDDGVQELAAASATANCRPPKILADPDRLSQVLDNLLDNAIRHSPENSTITVTIRPAKDGVECSVIDQGTGIPAQHLPFIFERFYRVDASRSRNRKNGGTGLGLAIARALINAQGGQISAQSVEGQGTTITFWLPAQ
ncbi:MAG TPA: ATP-binding protein, partial [Anaerolineales bacterium]|nr:ATP-binding protein [Anaerolineales bacterium]